MRGDTDRSKASYQEWITPYFQAYSGRFALYLILGTLTILTASALMFTSGYLISESSTQPYNILMVYVPIVGVRTFGISRAVIHYIERLVGHDTVLRILSKMRVRLYNILEPQALFIRSRYRTGDVLGALADDIEQLQNVYIRTVFPSVVAVIIYGIVIFALGRFDLLFALLMAAYIFILVAVLPYISLWLTRHTNREVKRERNRLYQKLTDAIMGIGDWVISGRPSEFLATYESDEERVAEKDRRLRMWARWRSLIGQLVVGVAVLSMIYWAGGQAHSGQIDPTLIAAFVLVVFTLSDAFLPLSDAVERIPQYDESLKRLDGMEDREGGEAAPTQTQLLEEVPRSVHIKVENISFTYEGNAATSSPLISEVSLDIPQGKRVMIIGRSGAGKSTLLRLIQGAMLPSGGSITMNDIPVSAYGDEISKLIAVLNQRPHLFDTTVANNIRLGRPDASDEQLLDAVQRAQLHELTDSLPAGLDTPMLETGQRFSGGERQRIALARILLQDTPVLVLDEPTVGLDPRTERELLTTIFRSTKGKSLIWVTHHLVGAEQMDEVIFMEHGKILMRGTHEELLQQEPRYRHLYALDRPE